MDQVRVVIVGGGFAGVAAARELRRLGHSALILEARDRLGGRTWTDHRLGHQLELGGTWVHWIQPHVWAEVTRYGLEVSQSPVPSRAMWAVADELRIGSPDDLWGLLGDSMQPLLASAREWFPLPYQPLSQPRLEDVDDISVAAALAELNLDEERAAVADGMWRTNFNGPIEQAALTQGLRWAAVANGDWQLMFEACATYRLKAGTRSLIEAMAADAGCEVRFGSRVDRIEHGEDGCVVTTTDGTRCEARAAIVTLPINALGGIAFDPALSPGKCAAAAEGQTSRGGKVWVRVRGEVEPFVAVGNATTAFSLVQYEYAVDGDSLLVAFSSDAARLDGNDVHEVTEALRVFVPGADVVASTCHDWVADDLTRETWPMLKAGQLTRYLAELQRPEMTVYLAGSDYANGWAGFIDGAIESGTAVARRVHALA